MDSRTVSNRQPSRLLGRARLVLPGPTSGRPIADSILYEHAPSFLTKR